MTVPRSKSELVSTTKPQLRVLRSVDEIYAIRLKWRELEQRDSGDLTYFQTFDWCANWAERIAAGQDGTSLHIITIWVSDKLIALLPAMVVRGAGGLRIMQALGMPHTQYSGMLTDPFAYGAYASKLLAKHLNKPDVCDLASFDLLPSHSPLAKVLDENFSLLAQENESSTLDLSVYENSKAFLASSDAKRRRSRSKRRNKLERTLGELNLRVIWPGDAEFAPLVHRCVEMKQQWLQETGRVSRGFSVDGYAEFLASLGGSKNPLDGAIMFVLEAAGEPIAIELSMIRAGRLYAYIGGFDWKLQKLSPGKVQMEATICWCIDNGVTYYDLLGNAAAYKGDWSNQVFALVTYNKAYSARGWAYGTGWLEHLRPWLKRRFEALPHGMRKMIAEARG